MPSFAAPEGKKGAPPDPAMVLSSRVFVKGLPPNLTDSDFRKHFSAGGRLVTDVKLIPQRRLGYVGFKSPEVAAEAVKYFNRTFIRMSKISVEIAKPIGDASLQTLKRKRPNGQHSADASKTGTAAEPASATSTNNGKRKREAIDESDPKLREFLEVMLPNRNPTKADLLRPAQDVPAEPTVVPLELDERASDAAYDEKPTTTQDDVIMQDNVGDEVRETSNVSHVARLAQRTEPSVVPGHPLTTGDAEQDEWLRSRTNRVLDLLKDDDGAAETETLQEHDPAMRAPRDVPNATNADDRATPSDEPEDEEEDHDGQDTEEILESIRATRRLFVRNLSYSATEDDLRGVFTKFGPLEEIHLAVDNDGRSKGFALVLYSDASSAIEAFQSADKTTFQGRLLHILPAAAKRDTGLDEFAMSKLPLKKQNLIRKKAAAASSSFNWNSLYMSQDAMNTAWADRLQVSKADLLDPTSSDAAVRQAIAETSIIQETKAYFVANGVDLNSFKSSRRGDTTILVKNFPYGTTMDEIRRLFEEHGAVLRVLMPPNGTIAIVQFAQPSQAKTAFMKLAYRRVKDSVLFLEKGPKELFLDDDDGQASQAVAVTDDRPVVGVQKLSVAELLERDDAVDGPVESTSTSLFVRNLNFATTTRQLAAAFAEQDGFVSARIKTKDNPKRPGEKLGMGFGFVAFRSKDQAVAAQKAMDGHLLDGHTLGVRLSMHKARDAAEERRKEDAAKKRAGQRTKIVVKNLPFEATKKDIRALFGTYGQLRGVRVPKTFTSKSRGFAFAEFVTPREAENAFNALRDTHLLGRRLVLEFAEADAVDPEEEIERMQRKMGGQANKVALQRLTGRGRKKVNIGGAQGDEDAP